MSAIPGRQGGQASVFQHQAALLQGSVQAVVIGRARGGQGNASGGDVERAVGLGRGDGQNLIAVLQVLSGPLVTILQNMLAGNVSCADVINL